MIAALQSLHQSLQQLSRRAASRHRTKSRGCWSVGSGDGQQGGSPCRYMSTPDGSERPGRLTKSGRGGQRRPSDL
jgi:hypothetical protein